MGTAPAAKKNPAGKGLLIIANPFARQGLPLTQFQYEAESPWLKQRQSPTVFFLELLGLPKHHSICNHCKHPITSSSWQMAWSGATSQKVMESMLQCPILESDS